MKQDLPLKLETAGFSGLSTGSLDQLKKNIEKKKSGRSNLQIILQNILNFFNLILFPVTVLLLLFGKYNDALFISFVAITNTIIAVYQEIRAKIILDNLTLINANRTEVIRDGKVTSITPEEICLGEYIIAKSGDQILADGKIIFAQNASLDESFLTGESDYVAKNIDDLVTSSTFVVTGKVIYIATAVGADRFSSKLLLESSKVKKNKTPLQQKINGILNVLVYVMLIIAAVTLLSAWNRQQAIDLAVLDIATVVSSMIPLGLVLITTISYAVAAKKMYSNSVLVQKISAVESMSSIKVLCMDKTGTITTNEISLIQILSADESKLSPSLINDIQLFANSIVDANKTVMAIKNYFHNQKYEKQNILFEKPFNSKDKFSGIIFDKNKAIIIGAPEIIQSQIKDLSHFVISKLQENFNLGKRCLLVATNDDYNHAKIELESIANFTVAAILIFEDQIRDEAVSTIKAFQERGILLKIISGDNQDAVAALARSVGFENPTAISGLELAKLDEVEFDNAVLKHRIYGRITPEQKEKIITSLQKQGLFTAMIGDGVNDVLAIKKADLGIAMNSGARMAKDVSDIVLINNSFGSLPIVLAQGDQIFSNIVKVSKLFVTKSIYSIIIILLIGYLSYDFPFLPRQITLISFLTVGIPALAVGLIPSKIHKPSRYYPTVFAFAISCGVFYSLGAVVAFILTYFHTGNLSAARSAIIAVLVLGGLFATLFTVLNEKITLQNIIDNKWICLILFFTYLSFLFIIETKTLREFFEIGSFSLSSWVFVIPIFLAASTLFVLERKYKIIYRAFR